MVAAFPGELAALFPFRFSTPLLPRSSVAPQSADCPIGTSGFENIALSCLATPGSLRPDLHFERINPDRAAWEKAWSSFPDRIVFQSPAWIAFLAEHLNAEPVLAALKDGNDTVGHFTGLMFKKFGLRILGSPFRGWSTPYMGFNLRAGVPRQFAAQALPRFALKELGCIHYEITDAYLSPADIAGMEVTPIGHPTIEVNLAETEDEIFNRMASVCRRNIRHAEKSGVTIEIATDAGLADDYITQYHDVMAKQGLVPHFGAERFRLMIRHVQPTGQLLMLRARDAEGRCIATGIYPGANEFAFYNNGSSWRQYQKLRPNELLHWHAMKYWRARGVRSYNMEGIMAFKQKFGGHTTSVPMFYQSKYKLLGQMRARAMPVAKAALKLAYRVKSLGRSRPAAAESAGEGD
jgi:hypothetical protein